jgi:hypothetical protein
MARSWDQLPLVCLLYLMRIASRAPDFFRIPQDRLSEVGFRVEI